MTTNSVLFTFWLALAPTEAAFEQSLADLDAAAQSIVEITPEEAIARLEGSLAKVEQYPRDLLRDSSAADKLARARVALVWAYLAKGDATTATTMMDEAIRSAAGRPLPLSGLGPDIRKLHDQRLGELEQAGTAIIEVDCDMCEVLIDDARSATPSTPVLLGHHRVWIFDLEDELEPMFSEVTLETPGQTMTLVFRAAKPEPGPIVELPSEPVFRPKVPRWAKILGMAVGAGLAVSGGVLLSLDGKCENGDAATPNNFMTTCRKVWNNEAIGYTFVGVGAGLFAGATIWLTVDETRANKSRSVNAMVSWTLRF
jgi:hypothetical protein